MSSSPSTTRLCTHVELAYMCNRGLKRANAWEKDFLHFKGSLHDTEHDICLKTRGFSADPPMFSLRLARRRSEMSFSLTLFWWICSSLSPLQRGLGKWTLSTMNKTTVGVVKGVACLVWAFEEQHGTGSSVIGADSGSRQSPAQGEKKPRLARLTGPFSVQSARECFVRCIKKKVRCGFYLAAVSLARAICCRVEFPSPRTSFKMLWPETRAWSLELFIMTPDTS